MKKLKDNIVKYSSVIDEEILKVDSFINVQVDSLLMDEIANEFYKKFKNTNPTKIMTIEASGIAPSVLVALKFKVPLIIVKKETSSIDDKESYFATVHSFTKNKVFNVRVPKKYLNKNDRVLIIDDFLATGQAILGCLDIIKKSESMNVGIGIIVEKTFQNGRKTLNDSGFDVYSLARIKSLKNNKVVFED
ncbi:xanthine phosphoribosyltransferase [Mycoplasma elephantis]|uniref:xanthine phosphoribosyltransferase n=1 Tax=Mycoplasma elephantis TaxID=114882 RepID=UPI0004895360|nr:xanthine phosphoribosyltransferase [Mycoplasma elephantis]